MNSASTSTQLTAITPLQSVTLIAQQEAELPDGAIDTPNRPIGFASIFLTLENPRDRSQILELLEVKVIAVDNNEIQLHGDDVQTIKLMPLENAVQDIHLSSPTGYVTNGKVKAIATYRINQQTHRIESPAVEIR